MEGYRNQKKTEISNTNGKRAHTLCNYININNVTISLTGEE